MRTGTTLKACEGNTFAKWHECHAIVQNADYRLQATDYGRETTTVTLDQDGNEVSRSKCSLLS